MLKLKPLEQMNPDRESAVAFDESAHKYRILTDPNHEYISVTAWIGTFFEPFNADKILARMRKSPKWSTGPYNGMTDEEIKLKWDNNRDQASEKGTRIHGDIDYEIRKDIAASLNSIMATSSTSETTERMIDKTNPSWKLYERFLAEHPTWKIVKTEWRLFDEESKVAGTIDALFQNEFGEYILVDWKRCKKMKRDGWVYDFATPWPICHLANTNYNHYTLQLNIYRYIIERHYGFKISAMYLAVLHPDYEPDNDRWLKISDVQSAVSILAANRKFQQS